MNSVDICLFVLFVIIVFEGYARGFVVSLLSLVRFAVGIPVSFIVADKFSSAVYANYFREAISERVLNGIENSGVDSYIESFKASVDSIPEIFRGSVDFSFLDSAGSEAVSQGMMNNIVDPIAEIITKVSLFVVTFVAFYVVTGILLYIVKKLSNSSKAPLRKTNKFLGAVFGMVKAMIFIFAIARIAVFFTENITVSDNAFLQQIASSAIIEFVNKFNPIMFI